MNSQWHRMPGSATSWVRRSTAAGLIVALGLLAVGCGDDDDSDSTTTTSAPTTTPSPETTGEADPDPDDDPSGSVEDLSGAAITLTQLAELDRPIALVTRPGSSNLFVAERPGRVVMVDPTSGASGDVVIDITGDTSMESERGLLSLAFHPDGDRLYLSFTDPNGDSRIDEWTMDGDTVDPDSRRVVYEQPQPFPNHNGGHIAFGPDGYLYFGLGDGGGGGDPLDAGQDFDTALGSIIRIDPTPSGDAPFTVPPDNPFADGGGEPEIWITGVRNPWRFSWDRQTGDLWIADVGQSALEEINVLFAAEGEAPGRGSNLGWAIFEGDQPYDGGPEPENYVPPIHTFGHGPACSVTGGFVSRGEGLPGLRGVYLYSDFCDNRIHGLLQRDGAIAEVRSLDVSVPGGQVVSFGEGPDGELYVLSLAGGLYRIDPA